MKQISLFLITLLSISLLVSSCNSAKKQDVPYQSGVHKGEVKEVLQTTQYTYLLVDENGNKKWLATTRMEAKPGEEYFYNDGYEMVNFKSNELNRTFASVYFLDRVGKTAEEIQQGSFSPGSEPKKAEVRKYELQIPKAEGGISIAELFEMKSDYNGKVVKISGKVVHYNPGIMNKNWIHLQDGTAFGDKFDLTATSDTEVKVGDIITLKGTVVLDKDFGAGYFYDVLLADAQLVK